MNCRPTTRTSPASWTTAAQRSAEARQLIERLQPTLPILLANLVSVGQVALTYQANIEQLLVLLPQVTAEAGGTFVANQNTKQDYRGEYLQLQPQPQPAAAVHHRVPAGPAAAGAHLRGLSASARPATCTAEPRRTRRSTCAAPRTPRA